MSVTEATPGVAPISKEEQEWLDRLPATILHPHKSFRRKYRKIMVRFEQQMRESSSLFKDQQRLQDISQRIAEQNDQILSLLLELNTQPQIPARLRYDINDTAATHVKSEKNEDEEVARSILRSTRYRIRTGEVRQPDYQEAERSLLDSIEFEPKRSYAKYLKDESLQRAGTLYGEDDVSPSLIGGFLSSKLEETYLQALDDFLEGKVMHSRSHATSNLGSRHAERSIERERESQLRNPMSVYNWLRKNQPNVFLQDGEDHKAKPANAASRKSKRESTLSKVVKAENEAGEDDTIGVEQSATKGGKRKRDEDGGYRPKGGHARPTKKRKEDSTATPNTSAKRTKRASMDTS